MTNFRFAIREPSDEEIEDQERKIVEHEQDVKLGIVDEDDEDEDDDEDDEDLDEDA